MKFPVGYLDNKNSYLSGGFLNLELGTSCSRFMLSTSRTLHALILYTTIDVFQIEFRPLGTEFVAFDKFD